MSDIDLLDNNNPRVQIETIGGVKDATMVLAMNSNDVTGLVEIINKWGEQIDVDTADATLTAGQKLWPIKRTVQDYIFLDSPIQLYAVSTSTDDDIAGIGARSIKGMYHDINGEMQIFELDMDGTTNVALPTTSYGVFRFAVESSGSSNTNVGQLKIVDGSGNIYAPISIGEGQTQIAVLRIPNNRKAVIRAHKVDYARVSPAANEAVLRLRIRRADGTIVTKWDPTITTDNPIDNKEYFMGGINVRSGEWIFWEAITVSANNTPLRGSFDVRMVPV